MDDDGNGPGTRCLARDANSLTNTIFDILPSSRAMSSPSSPSIRASPIPSPAKPSKRKGSSHDSDDNTSNNSILPNRYNTRAYWITNPSKRHRMQHTIQDANMEQLHQSTCLNLNNAGSNESDLWILPDFDEWELDNDTVPQQPPPQQQPSTTRAPILERAVNSNRERLRRRLEGDGWDFVGGKYGEDEKTIHDAVAAAAVYQSPSQSEESVDEEFDVVVLPVVQVSC